MKFFKKKQKKKKVRNKNFQKITFDSLIVNIFVTADWPFEVGKFSLLLHSNLLLVKQTPFKISV